METIVLSIELGLIFAIMSTGIFISFKILNLPDLTIDGSYTLGAAVGAVVTVSGHPYLALLAAFLVGGLAGTLTGVLHTKLNIDPILSGILVMTGLYSVNLRILGKPTLSIFGKINIYDFFKDILPRGYEKLIINLLFVCILVAVLLYFFKTQLGVSLIATGDNEDMVRASSINANLMKILGLTIGNALVAFSAALMVNQLGFADISGGTGMMVIGLASIIVGEAIFGKSSIIICFIGVIFGAIIYRYILSISYMIGLNAGDLKLLSSILVIVAIGLPSLKKLFKGDKSVKNK